MIAVEPAVVVSLVVVAGLVALVGVFLVVRWAIRRARAAAEALLPPDTRRRSFARSLGQTSLGPTQFRGNGTLALTADALVFVLWVPRRLVVIPLAHIVAVDVTHSHLKQRLGRRMLRVRWSSDQGEDAIAWQLADLDSWLATLARTTRPGT